MSVELIVILCGAGAALLAVLLLRFGKRIAIFLLVAGGLVAVIAVAVALAGQSAASYQTARAAETAARAAETAAVGQSITGVAVTVLVILLLVALGGASYFWLRWRLTQRRLSWSMDDHGGQWLPPFTRRRRRRALSQYQPVVYIVDEDEEEEEPVDLAFLDALDLTRWGF